MRIAMQYNIYTSGANIFVYVSNNKMTLFTFSFYSTPIR